MLTKERFDCMSELGKGSTYKSFPIDIDFKEGAAAEFVASVNGAEIRDTSLATVFNKVDAILKRREEATRLKVELPILCYVKGEWKEAVVKSIGSDLSVRIQVGKGGMSIPMEEAIKRCVLPTEEVKDALEQIIEWEKLIVDAEGSIDELTKKVPRFDPAPYLKVREEEIKAAEEEAAKKAEAESKKAEKAAKKVAKKKKFKLLRRG